MGSGKALGNPKESGSDGFNNNVEGLSHLSCDLIMREPPDQRRIFSQFSDSFPSGESVGLDRLQDHETVSCLR